MCLKSVLGGEIHDSIHSRIEKLHKKLKDDYSVRWELDCYLLALYHNKDRPREWMVLDISDTFHYHNLPDLTHIIRNTLIGLCTSQWLQRLFNMFLCGKRYRRMANTTECGCQLTAAIINTLHGLLLGLYPFNERRASFEHRVLIAGSIHEVLTSGSHMRFISEHQNLVCLALIEYILNAVHDFCPVEWQIIGITPGAKSQCLAIVESFRETTVNTAVQSKETFWSTLETDAQASVAASVKFFRDTVLYQHKPRSVLQTSTAKHLGLALQTRVIQNSSSIFGQLKAALPSITFKESEALEDIWTTIYTRHLPAHAACKQMDSLTRLGSMCDMVEKELHHIPVCMTCALTRRADVLKALFRYDPTGGMLVCNECCNHESIVHINLLGRILYIREKAIVLCEACLQPTYWDTPCRCAVEKESCVNECCACGSTNIASSKEIIDVKRFRMRTIHFCYKHSLTCILNSATVYDERTMEEEFRNRVAKSVR